MNGPTFAHAILTTPELLGESARHDGRMLELGITDIV
jgi:hypothetical protein